VRRHRIGGLAGLRPQLGGGAKAPGLTTEMPAGKRTLPAPHSVRRGPLRVAGRPAS
jgi:hypothetical protein